MSKIFISIGITLLVVIGLSISCNAAISNNYTGWAKSSNSNNRYYYENGTRAKGVTIISGKPHLFDNNGVYLGIYPQNKEYQINFSNDYNIKIEDGKIHFTIKVNNTEGRNSWDYEANPHFSLYVYDNGKFKNISYKSDMFSDYTLVMDGDIITFSKPLSEFNYDFKEGLYCVKATVIVCDKLDGGITKRDENGNPIQRNDYVIGEFNLV